jgi:RNA polymerase sigma-70 factor (ECF subfamily)
MGDMSAIGHRASSAADGVGARLFRDHAQAVYAFVARRLGRQLASDLTADTFRIALEQADRYDAARGEERAWLFGIANNLVRRHWRTETRRLQAMARAAHDAGPIGDPLLETIDRIDALSSHGQLLLAIAELDPDDRDLLVLVGWERCSYADAAAALGIPAGTARSRMHRIRRTLRTSLRCITVTEENNRHE